VHGSAETEPVSASYLFIIKQRVRARTDIVLDRDNHKTR